MAKGRKSIYTPEELKAFVNSYHKTHPQEGKITIKNLIEFTGIPKDTWYRCKEVKQYLEELNTLPIKIKFTGKELELPTVIEILNRCNGNEEKLKLEFSKLMDIIVKQDETIRSLTNNASQDDIEISLKLKEEIESLKRINKKLNDKLNRYIYNSEDDIDIEKNLDKLESTSFMQQIGELIDD